MSNGLLGQALRVIRISTEATLQIAAFR